MVGRKSFSLALLKVALPAVVLAIAGAVWAEGSGGDLKLDLKAFKVVRKAGGGETLIAAERIKPREIVEYQAKYSNNGERTLRNIQATLPIPAALEYIPGTASPTNAQASLDGKTFAAIPLKRTVKAPDGTSKVVPVPYSEYRYLRWSLSDLAGGKSTTVSARARLQ